MSDKSQLSDTQASAWDSPAVSAFDRPMVVDAEVETESPENIEDVNVSALKGGAKPNYVLLGVAGLIGVLLMGAMYGIYSELTKGKAVAAVPRRAEAVELSVAAVTPTASPLAAASTASATVTPFDSPDVAVGAGAGAPSASAAAALVQAATAPQGGAPAPAVPPVSGLVTPGIASPATSASPVLAQVATAAPAKPAATKSGASRKEPQKRPAVTQRLAKAQSAKRAVTRMAKVSGKASPSAEPRKEEFISSIPADMVVRGFFPVVGPDVQAWVYFGGKTRVLRAGDVLTNGIRIVSLNPERGEISTSAGIISSRGGQ